MHRAEERAGSEDVGQQALMRGLDTAPFVRLGLSRSAHGRRSGDRPHSHVGNSPAVVPPSLLHDSCLRLFPLDIVATEELPVERTSRLERPQPGTRLRLPSSQDLAIDRPDEGQELTGDRRGDDRPQLAFALEPPEAPATKRQCRESTSVGPLLDSPPFSKRFLCSRPKDRTECELQAWHRRR
jgi:hypothetical protein